MAALWEALSERMQTGAVITSKVCFYISVCMHTYVYVCVCIGMSTVSLCSAVRAPQPSAAES